MENRKIINEYITDFNLNINSLGIDTLAQYLELLLETIYNKTIIDESIDYIDFMNIDDNNIGKLIKDNLEQVKYEMLSKIIDLHFISQYGLDIPKTKILSEEVGATYFIANKNIEVNIEISEEIENSLPFITDFDSCHKDIIRFGDPFVSIRDSLLNYEIEIFGASIDCIAHINKDIDDYSEQTSFEEYLYAKANQEEQKAVNRIEHYQSGKQVKIVTDFIYKSNKEDLDNFMISQGIDVDIIDENGDYIDEVTYAEKYFNEIINLSYKSYCPSNIKEIGIILQNEQVFEGCITNIYCPEVYRVDGVKDIKNIDDNMANEMSFIAYCQELKDQIEKGLVYDDEELETDVELE